MPHPHALPSDRRTAVKLTPGAWPQSETCTPGLRFAGERGIAGLLQPEREAQYLTCAKAAARAVSDPYHNSCIQQKGKCGRRLKASNDIADLRRDRGLRRDTTRGHEALLAGVNFAMRTRFLGSTPMRHRVDEMFFRWSRSG